jgi:outer membrane immunogenic protein
MVAPEFSWTGWYVGVNAGGAWGHSDLHTSTVFSPTGYFATTSVPAINGVGAQNVKRSGFTGGGQAGYNWQFGRTVFGLEADFDYLGLKGSTSGSALYPCCAPTGFTVSSSVKTDWLLTFRPRLGFAADHWLLYVTGGLAVSQVKANFNFSDTFATAAESAAISSTKAGWTAGVGAEYALAGPWSVKLEYLHVDLGSISTTSTNLTALTPPIAFPTNVFSHSVNLRSDIVRFGVNYRL